MLLCRPSLCILISSLILCLNSFADADIYGSKEWIPQTRGSIWPKPHHQIVEKNYFSLNPNSFRFAFSHWKLHNCHILRSATSRYYQILKKSVHIFTQDHKKKYSWNKLRKPWKLDNNFIGTVSYLEIDLKGHCDDKEYPSIDMVEDYTLNISRYEKKLSSNTIWGILRGLESFSQLTYLPQDNGVLFINESFIQDKPRFGHRGLLLDTARHYISKSAILRTLDAMSYNKFNVLHWHLTDLQSFSYQSTTFPELSDKGAWDPDYAIYGQHDVKEIIEYARLRGIRVLPEFDTPGHTASWGDSHKELLTTCYANGEPTGHYGPLDVTKNFTYKFVNSLLSEVTKVFPEQYVHIGGDEVDFTCWMSNENVTKFMQEKNITGDYIALESYYIQRVIEMVNNLSAKSIVWEEVFTNGVQFPQSTVVQVWKSDEDYKAVLSQATKAGKPVLLSACYYLDVAWEWFDWTKYYKCDPTDFEGSEEQKKLVLGGEVALWAEFVNEYNLDMKLWPRAAAGAERLWSDVATPGSFLQFVPAAARLEEHVCRLIKRGIASEPASGPNYCI